ncbi:unnamed protein product [Caenorhabditis brenneri]
MESIVKPISGKPSNPSFRTEELERQKVILISADLTIQYVEENASLIGSDSSEQFQDSMREITNNTLDDAQPSMAAIHEMGENAFTDFKRIKFIERCLKSPLLELSRLFAHYQGKIPKLIQAIQDAQEAMEHQVEQHLE